MGSLIESARNKQFNTAIVVNGDGVLVKKYRKIHLFPVSQEHKSYTAGRVITTFNMGGVKCGITICYDLRFPELFRALMKKGVKIVFVPANWPASRREHWLALLRARSIENQFFVAGINRVGKDPQLDYSGDSVVFDPWGKQLACAKTKKEELIFANLDFKCLEIIRKEYPFLREI